MTRQWMLIAWVLAAGSCSADDAKTDPSASAQAADSEPDDDFKGCPEEIPPFAPGISGQSAHFSAKLLSAMPVEPERYTSNRWSIAVSASDGSSVPGVNITHGQTFMPVHGHDGRVEPQMTALSDPGEFQVDRLNFTMRGPWEVRLWMTAPSVAEELVVFHICVAK